MSLCRYRKHSFQYEGKVRICNMTLSAEKTDRHALSGPNGQKGELKMSNKSNVKNRVGLSVFLFAMAGLVQARTITIGPGVNYDFSAIQTGIDAASSGDTILVASGEYIITDPITFRGKAITLQSEAGRDQTTIRMGTPADAKRASVVIFENNETVASVLEGFTITGGTGFRLWVPGESEFAWCGGGILFHASSGTVRNCAIVQNRAKHAGGVMTCSEAFVILIDCIVAGNTAEEGACGGVMCWDSSSVTMTECIIKDNSTMSAGGGVCCGSHDSSTPSSVTMTDCEVVSNTAARFGGGIYARSKATEISSLMDSY